MGPRIAVSLCGHAARRCVIAREQYLDAIRRTGAEPITVDPADALPEEFDGLCLTGGGDIDPARYGEVNSASLDIDDARDTIELAHRFGTPLFVLDLAEARDRLRRYREAFGPDTKDLASVIEQRFAENDWTGSWRAGVYPFPHYHSTSHEALGVFSGSATLRLGGAQGTTRG